MGKTNHSTSGAQMISSEYKEAFSTKTNPVAPLVSRFYQFGNNGVFPRRNPAQYSDDAFKRNVIAYQSVGKVSRCAATIPLEVWIGDEKQEKHPLLDLLNRPNQMQAKGAFFESVVAFLMLTGNTYIHGLSVGGPPLELWGLRPDRMRVLPSQFGVGGYAYDMNGQKKTWNVDPVTGASEVLHVKFFNPLDDWYGMSPVEAAAWAVDAHNLSGEWNQSLLQNSGKPAGALVYNPGEGMPNTLSEKQRDALREALNSQTAGTKNAGRALILDGGLDWRQISMSAVDMDWLNGKREAAREIALAFGVPPMLLGIPGDNTYSNQKEAREAFYDDTVLPVLQYLLDDVNNWLSPAYGEGVTIKANPESLPAYAAKRQARWQSVQTADWLTINEKREATGYSRIETPDADAVMTNPSLVPLGSEPDANEDEEGKEEEGELKK
jgi:HK97 family phage portal protein